jgi:arginyl-tRNA synthetase
MIESHLERLLRAAVAAAQQAGTLPASVAIDTITLEQPRQAAHGDLSTNLALTLARAAKMAPRAIAEALMAHVPSDSRVTAVRIAGPGFINFDIAPAWYLEQLEVIAKAATQFGHSTWGSGQRCQVEFVSANPTGPLHVGHGRNAVLGDVLGNVLAAVGFEVSKEYYVNDAGVQITTLGKSVVLRLRELQGERIDFPTDCYQGAYITDIARQVLDAGEWTAWATKTEAEQWALCGTFAGDIILTGIKADLAAVGVIQDVFFCESSLHADGAIASGFAALREAGHLFERDDALWFRSTTFGDDKDRVVRKSDGSLTYFAADIAYHANKFARGFDRLIDVWGADHAGYVPRMQAMVEALGHPPTALDCVLTQLVNLIREGKIVSMSTRRGEFDTLCDLVNEVGRDVVRYFYLMRSHNAQLDFDMNLATARSLDNPVFYIQYAHARIASLFDKVADTGATFAVESGFEAAQLSLPEEVVLARMLGEFPHVVSQAARELEPHRITFYLLELARKFQSYYTCGKRDDRYRVLDQQGPALQAKLTLLYCVQTVIRNGLGILGISAPDRLERVEGEAA